MKMWEPGQILWAVNLDDVIHKVKIVDGPIERDEAPEAYYNVYYYDLAIWAGVLESRLFRTYKEALAKRADSRRKEKEYYKSKIKTQEDLLQFMLERMQVESESCEYPAVEAAKEKCRELFNIEIE